MKVFRITFLLLLLITTLPLKAQLRGYVIDEATGDSIPYASAIYRGHNVAVASNINGQFTIARHEGWVLTFSAVGYISKSITITSSTKQNFNVKLKPDTKALKEVVVKTKRRRYSRKNWPCALSPLLKIHDRHRNISWHGLHDAHPCTRRCSSRATAIPTNGSSRAR